MSPHQLSAPAGVDSEVAVVRDRRREARDEGGGLMMMRFWIWELPTSSCSALPSFNGCSRLALSTVRVALYM